MYTRVYKCIYIFHFFYSPQRTICLLTESLKSEIFLDSVLGQVLKITSKSLVWRRPIMQKIVFVKNPTNCKCIRTWQSWITNMTAVFCRFIYFNHRRFRNQNLPELSIKRCLSAVKSVPLDSDERDQDLKHYADFKNTIKTLNVDYKDGSTCLHLPCKLCAQSNPGKVAFVNKHTGSFYCPNCDIRVSLLQAKIGYEKKKPIVNRHQAETANIYTRECVQVTQVPAHVCEALQIKGLKPVDFEMLDANYDPDANVIKFPLNNVANRLVGEKFLYMEDGREETLQNKHMSGILLYEVASKQKVIVVANLLDFLSLIAQRIDTRKYKHYCIIFRVCISNS